MKCGSPAAYRWVFVCSFGNELSGATKGIKETQYLRGNCKDVALSSNISIGQMEGRSCNLPAIDIGRKMRMKGPRHLSLSLKIATTTVNTTAGTYGGTVTANSAPAVDETRSTTVN